jgi:hypothetical protein
MVNIVSTPDERAPTAPEAKIDLVPIWRIRPCPENSVVYSEQSLDDPDIITLIESIKVRGIMDPIHITADNVIISGHRRRFCAERAGLKEIPAFRNALSYKDDRGEVLKLLVEANSQRKKTPAMLIREVAMKIDPKEAHAELKRERRKKECERMLDSGLSDVEGKNLKGRAKISEASMPFLRAALAVIHEQRAFWPLSVRQIHYRLLGPNAPLMHASKPNSKYENDSKGKSYKALTTLLSRGRIEGRVPWPSIDDMTRPEDLNNHYWNAEEFFKAQMEKFLVGYTRNRQQSQTNHIEIIAEKLTVKTILEGVAEDYSIPLTISRGHSGPTVKRKIVERYRRSKKQKLILLVVSDLDPAGDAIAQDVRDAFERDFGISDELLEVYKVALTIDQVTEFRLPPSMEAKENSPTYAEFVERYGEAYAYELEALEPSDLQQLLIEAIEAVMDMPAYEAELAGEEADAVEIQAKKIAATEFFKTAA